MINHSYLIVFWYSSSSELQQWELLVLSALKWDISVVTPLDFLEHFLSRLAIRDLDVNKVRLHAQAFICLAAQGKDSCLFVYSWWISGDIWWSIYCIWGECTYNRGMQRDWAIKTVSAEITRVYWDWMSWEYFALELREYYWRNLLLMACLAWHGRWLLIP